MSDYFTAEERAKLTGFFALNNEPFEFTPPEFMDLPEEKRPVFELQEFNFKAQQKREELGLELDQNDTLHVVLKLCILGWNNYRTINGDKIVFTLGADGTPTDDCIKSIGMAAKLSILERINGK